MGESSYQKQQNNLFKDASTSPLKKKDLKNFKGLDFFPIDSSLVIYAGFKKIENAPILQIPMTIGEPSFYKKYGIATFTIEGKEQQLTIYQDQDNLSNPVNQYRLFLPFTDETNGKESYKGGRYMSLSIADIRNDKILLNFNNTYNPYCAYNENYSCPIVPEENHLNVAIKAGIKNFKK